MSEYERLKKQKDEILNTRRERLVERLLEAAFHELQHDTGPSDPEYVYQRKLLKKKFTEIMEEK
jgi:hypothetical protein